MKAQAPADFIVEFTLPNKGGLTDETEWWMIQSSTTLDGETLKYRVQLKFLATNNEAEYGAILIGLRVENALRAKNLLLQSDSKLVIV